MTDLADPRPVAAAAKALLVAAVSAIAGAQVLEYDEVRNAKVLPNQHLIWTLSERVGSETRTNARQGTVGWRLHVRFVAKTSAGARELWNCVNSLRWAVLNANDTDSTPLQFESGTDIGPDEGYVSGSADWTFVL